MCAPTALGELDALGSSRGGLCRLDHRHLAQSEASPRRAAEADGRPYDDFCARSESLTRRFHWRRDVWWRKSSRQLLPCCLAGTSGARDCPVRDRPVVRFWELTHRSVLRSSSRSRTFQSRSDEGVASSELREPMDWPLVPATECCSLLVHELRAQRHHGGCVR